MSDTAHPYRLPPRLTRGKDFRRVSRRGRHFRHSFLRMAVLPGSEGRVGFVVPERIVNLATRRNRIRRLLREGVRKWWRWLRSGSDIVLFVDGIPEVDSADFVEAAVLSLFLKADMFCEEGAQEARRRLGELGRHPGEKT